MDSNSRTGAALILFIFRSQYCRLQVLRCGDGLENDLRDSRQPGSTQVYLKMLQYPRLNTAVLAAEN